MLTHLCAPTPLQEPTNALASASLAKFKKGRRKLSLMSKAINGGGFGATLKHKQTSAKVTPAAAPENQDGYETP